MSLYGTPQSSSKARAQTQDPGSASTSKHSRSGSITNSVVERTVAYKESLKERQNLEKANFDLKMKVFHLEDALKRFTGENGEFSGMSFNEMKKELEEKNAEIEQKNVLILKAKAAIEALKAETQKFKLDEEEMNNYTRSLEERCVKATENEIMITAEFKKQHLNLESEFVQLRAENEEKTAALSDAEIKIASMQKQLDEFEAMRKGIEEERSEFYKEVLAIKEGDGSLQGQLAQSQAHNKLYEDQIHEITCSNEELKREIASLVERKSGVEADQARLIGNLQQQLHDLRMEYEQSVMKLTEEHSKALEQTKMDFAHNWTVNDQLSRQNERNEFMLLKEEWQEKFNQKNSELEIVTFKYNSTLEKLEDLKKQLNDKSVHVETLTSKITYHIEQHNELSTRHEELTNDHQEFHDIHANVLKDRDQLEEKHAELHQTHSDAKNRLNELQILVGSLETENKHLLKDLEAYKRKIDTLEDLTRDNERLKYDYMVISRKHAELENDIKDHVAHRDRLTDDLQDHKEQIRGHLEKIKGHEETHKILHEHKASSEQALHYERERASTAEEKIVEQHGIIDELRLEIATHQDTIGSHTTKLNDHSARVTDLTNALASMFNSIQDWEAVITIVLEGVDSEKNRSSPIHHDDNVDDPETSLGFLSMSSFDLIRKVSARTERMDGKIARLVKLRKTIDSQMNKLLSTYTEKLSHANDKCALLEYKATDLARSLNEARTKIETHHGLLSTHTQRFEEFRDKISADHAERMKDLADNHSALQHIYELEKQKCSTMSEELEKSQKEIVELKELVQKYVTQEEKMEEVSETNRLLSFEVDDRGEKLKTLHEEHEQLIKEYQTLQRKEEEESNVLSRQAQQIQTLEEEVRYLSSRQMDPTLQQTIMQTQDMLQYHIDSKSTNKNSFNETNNYNWKNADVDNTNESEMTRDMMMKRNDSNMPLSASSLLTSSSSKYRFNPSPPNLKSKFTAFDNDIDGNGMESSMAMSYSRGSFNPSPPNLKGDRSLGFTGAGERDLSTSMIATGIVNTPGARNENSVGNGFSKNNEMQTSTASDTRRNGKMDIGANFRRPGVDLNTSAPAGRVQDPAISLPYSERGSVQLQDPTPSRRLDMKTLGEQRRESNVVFPYRGSNVVASTSLSSPSSSSSIPQGSVTSRQQHSLSSSSSFRAASGGTISLGNPRGYDEVNPMAVNIKGSPNADVATNSGAKGASTAGVTPYKTSSPSYVTTSSHRWEYSNSITPLQRQSFSRSGSINDSYSNRLEDIEHRKSKFITKVMNHQ